MARTNQTPTRRLPVRAAKLRGNSNPVHPTTPRPGGRVTRSSAAALSPTPSPSGSATKRAASPDPRLTSPNKRTRQRRTQPGQYAEFSDEDEDEDGDDDGEGEQSDHSQPSQAPVTDSDDEPLLSPIRRKAKSTPTKMKSTPVKSRKTRATSGARSGFKKHRGRTALTKLTPTKAPKKSNKPVVSIPLQNDTGPPVFPPWNQLPYYVLLRIFEYAAGLPITLNAAKWLLDTSLICRAFTEPALTALYRYPPLLTPHMAHGFTSLLSKSTDQTIFNYRQKVECLEIEAGAVAAKTYRGQNLDFKALLNNTPRLSEVYVWHEKDQAPYRDLYENIKWTYPVDMFLALGVTFVGQAQNADFAVVPAGDVSSVPTLRSWLWNRRMLGSFPLESLKAMHKFPAFHGLRKLVLTNFQLLSVGARDPDEPGLVNADNRLVNNLVQSVTVLPKLTHLVVECSTAVNGRFLFQLPKTIEHLELICCWEVTADHFADYLLSHGNALRRLTLHHNQSLSLAWLPVLGGACPRLESLRMNMTYYSSLSTYNTSDPTYDKLLTADQIPSWPSTLRHLDLKNLRRWDRPAAEMFFQSLLDSAPHLLDLRHIEIKAMIDISIRERAKLRDEWEAKLKKVFLREWVDPLPHFTLRPPRPQLPDVVPPPSQQATHNNRKKRSRRGANNPESPSPRRRSGRIATLPSGPPSRASSTGRDMRAPGARPTYVDPDTDEDIVFSSASESSEPEEEQPDDDRHHRSRALSTTPAEEEEKAPPFIQGLCTTVDIRFDNQKIVEQPFEMSDFLDDSSDDPTDEDWSEDAGGGYESDHRHAW